MTTPTPKESGWRERFEEQFVEVNKIPLYVSGENIPQQITTFIAQVEATAIAATEARVVNEDTSDGYHTFKELYEFRLLYNAHLFNEWAAQGKYDVHKSQRHNDGELCFGRDDYFVVVATLPTGQISNHYPMTDWDLFKCEAVEKAKAQWDGHTSQDVADRLRALFSSKTGI